MNQHSRTFKMCSSATVVAENGNTSTPLLVRTNSCLVLSRSCKSPSKVPSNSPCHRCSTVKSSICTTCPTHIQSALNNQDNHYPTMSLAYMQNQQISCSCDARRAGSEALHCL